MRLQPRPASARQVARLTNRSNDRLIRIADLRHRTGLSTATIYRKMEDSSFPQRRKVSIHVVAWYEGDVDAWVAGFDQNAAAQTTDATDGSAGAYPMIGFMPLIEIDAPMVLRLLRKVEGGGAIDTAASIGKALKSGLLKPFDLHCQMTT